MNEKGPGTENLYLFSEKPPGKNVPCMNVPPPRLCVAVSRKWGRHGEESLGRTNRGRMWPVFQTPILGEPASILGNLGSRGEPSL